MERTSGRVQISVIHDPTFSTAKVPLPRQTHTNQDTSCLQAAPQGKVGSHIECCEWATASPFTVFWAYYLLIQSQTRRACLSLNLSSYKVSHEVELFFGLYTYVPGLRLLTQNFLLAYRQRILAASLSPMSYVLEARLPTIRQGQSDCCTVRISLATTLHLMPSAGVKNAVKKD